jgi:ribosomal protein S18 acetylase RimI-like enzyme
MSVRLRPMREDELPEYLDRLRAEYALDMVENGGMAEDAARRKAAADVATVFPDGLASDVDARVVEDDSGAAVGYLVFAEREQHGGRYAFVYDIRIEEARQGQGLGRAAMELLEAEARARGLPQVQLNVFGGNEPARALYRSLGFDELSVQMGKELR